MRPADTQVLARSNERSMSTSSAKDQERSKRKASELISGREERDSTAVRVEHLNGHEQHHESVAEGQHNKSRSTAASKGQMITGCVPCLMVGIPCNPNNPRCRMAMSTEWSVNDDEDNASESADQSLSPKSVGLNTLRLDTKWRRNWRERHSLNFFVAFSAPQMAGFFENAFWSQCIQYSHHEPVVLHAVSAIGSLHESILRGAFQNEKTKAQAIEFALTQCNRSIAYLTGTNNRPETDLNGFGSRKSLPVSKLALIACVLFTCFESMQGHCDSAVRHALQGRTLMEAHYAPIQNNVNNQEDDVELLRPLVERLEVQATALLDQRDRSATDETISVPPLPVVDRIYNLDHAHATLHSAMNSNMRYAQRSHPDSPADHHAITHAKMTMRYGPWYARWEVAFSAWLAENDGKLSNMDRKRAMVLKANQLVGTMIARVDQREGPAAYHPFDEEFRAIVDLSREVLSDFSCPPLPSLTASGAGTPYFSCSLWVTDPLWMAISRCRDPETRQAAFELLRQNPRQEGIWHTGPKTSSSLTRKAEKSPTSLEAGGSENSRSSKEASSNSSPGSGTESVALGEVPEDVSHSEAGGNMRARSEWVDLMANSTPQSTSSDDASG